MINAPHEHAKHRVARSEHFHLLLHEMFLFGLGFGGEHDHRAGGAAGVTERRHHHGHSPVTQRFVFLSDPPPSVPAPDPLTDNQRSNNTSAKPRGRFSAVFAGPDGPIPHGSEQH